MVLGSVHALASDVNDWVGFLVTFYQQDIEELLAKGNGEGVLDIDLRLLEENEPAIAEGIQTDPKKMSDAHLALRKLAAESHRIASNKLWVAAIGEPMGRRVSIGEIGSQHMGKLVTIDGLVKKITPLIPTLMVADYRCRSCGANARVPQNDEKTVKPGTCDCGANNAWSLQADTSDYEDFQRAQIQERPDTIDGGRQPEKAVMELRNGNLKAVVPGDRVEVTGRLRFKQKKASREMESIFDVVGVRHHDIDYSEIEISDDFVEKAAAFAAKGNVIPRLVDSLATSIYGMKFEKTAILLSLFGGCQRKRSDGVSRRGHIHILMVGSPGVAKTMLIRYFSKITPRGIMASGKGASGIGLTAAVTKNDLSDDGSFAVEAGAMVMANDGTMFLDELDKMDAKDASAMHDALEVGLVTVNKAGLNVTLNASCNVIAAANPSGGRFNPTESLPEQINLTPALVSRFDLIFILQDIPTEEKDSALVDHIFNTELGATGNERLSDDFIRTYIAFARKLNPRHTEASLAPFKPYFLSMRTNVDNTTARQLEALMRLSEAHAKANLRSEVTVEDSQAALTIHRAYLESQALDPRTNKLNLGQFNGVGDTLSQSDKVQVVAECIKTCCKRDIRGHCDEMAVIVECEKRGIAFADAAKYIDELQRTQRAYAPGGPGTIAMIQ